MGFFEMVVPIFQTTRRHIPEYHEANIHIRDHVKPQTADLASGFNLFVGF
jgi:hypothetical protein